MNLIRSFFMLLILTSLVSNAQNKSQITTMEDKNPIPIYYRWLGTESRILDSMKLVYKKPAGFEEIGEVECFKSYPRLERMFTCIMQYLKSNDDQFIAFMPVFKIFTQEDSISMKSLFPGQSFDFVDKKHINQIKTVIRFYQNGDSERNWKNMVRYYPEKEAKSKFNADTVIRFTLILAPQDYYKKKFKYVDALFLQRKGRGYINFYCFYTDKAKDRLELYWKKIEGVLRYED